MPILLGLVFGVSVLFGNGMKLIADNERAKNAESEKKIKVLEQKCIWLAAGSIKDDLVLSED